MQDKRDIAIELMRQKHFSAALEVFTKLIDEAPNDYGIYYMAGQCARFTNDLPTAINLLTKSSLLKNDEPQVFLALGIALQLDKKYELAITALKEATRLNPSLFSAYNSIGLTYRKTGHIQLALEWYRKAAEGIVGAAVDETHKDRNRCYREDLIDGKKTLVMLPYAFEKTRTVLRSDSLYAIVSNNIGVCLAELGDLKSARDKFRESIDCTPEGYDYPDPHRYLADIGE